MRHLYLALPLALAIASTATAQTTPTTAAPAATAVAQYSVEETELGTMLDDPAAKAVIAKHLPEIVNSEQIDMARGLTLKSLQNYAADKVTDEKLAAISADLAKLPAKK